VPIAARWRRLDALPPARGREAMPGVYELADEAKRVVYIGQSAKDVPNRIRQHLTGRSGATCVAERAVYWRYRYARVPQAEEAALLATFKSRFGTLPLCNRAAPLPRGASRRYLERTRGS
jgi:predicted GIY-YIG superfamily endonuclease